MFDSDKAKRYASILNKYDISVSLLCAYFNPVHSVKNKTVVAIEKFKNHLEYSHMIGCQCVGTETGSYNDDQWTYNDKNRSLEAYHQVLNIFQELVFTAESTKSLVAIEGAYNHVIYSPQLLKKLIDDLNSNHSRVIVDLYNYLDISNYQKRYEIFDEAIRLLKNKIVIFHLKDFIREGNKLKQVGLGQGLMDFEYLISTIVANCPNADLIFEGVTGTDIPSSISHIKNIIKRGKHGCK